MEGSKSQDKINDAHVFVFGNEKRQQVFPNSKSIQKRERKNPLKESLPKIKASSAKAFDSIKKFFKDFFSSKRNRIIAILITAAPIIIATILIVLSQTIWKSTTYNSDEPNDGMRAENESTTEIAAYKEENKFYMDIFTQSLDIDISQKDSFFQKLLETETNEGNLNNVRLLYLEYLYAIGNIPAAVEQINKINGDGMSCYEKIILYNHQNSLADEDPSLMYDQDKVNDDLKNCKDEDYRP